MTVIRPRVVVIGLDCVTPQLLFGPWVDDLPCFRHLITRGAWGPLRSVDPPITVPAWSCMLSGCNPAQLGLYGFRHRRLGSYHDRYFALSDSVRQPRVWDILSERGLHVGLLGVPQTYPPYRVKGFMISGFLAPSTRAIYTYPAPLMKEITAVVGDYRLDVERFRTDERDRILAEVIAMTNQRFDLFRHLLSTRGGDFMMMVEIGPDRLHHAFWRFLGSPGHPYQHVIRDYYRLLDRQLAATLALLDQDCHIFVVSDHGARAMEGGFCLNDWLIDRGLLRLQERPPSPLPFQEGLVDWGRTRAWGWGGYYGRIFVNLQGREPQGQVRPQELDVFLEGLRAELAEVAGPDGRPMGNRTVRPKEMVVGGSPQGDYPDLMLFAGDLAWRVLASVGHESLFTTENDTGPDDANHDYYGVYIHTGPHTPPGRREGLRLLDVGPTILEIFGLGPEGPSL